MAHFTEFATLRTYLDFLDKQKRITHKQEKEYLQKIEAVQTEFLQKGLSSAFFRQSLATLFDNIDLAAPDQIIKASRKLNADSTTPNIEAMATLIQDAKLQLQMEGEIPFSELQLSGNLVYWIVQRIKQRLEELLEKDALEASLKAQVSDPALWHKLNSLLKNNQVDEASDLIGYELPNKDFSLWYERYKALEKSLLNARVEDSEDLLLAGRYVVEYESRTQKYQHFLINHNLRLVVARAKLYMNRGLDLDELIQEGNIGLMRAIAKLDLSGGTKLATYATWWVDQAIRRAISNKSRTIRIPTNVEFSLSQLQAAKAKLLYSLGRKATEDELAEHLNMSLADLRKLQEANWSRVTTPELSDDDNTDIVDFNQLVDEFQETPEEESVVLGLRRKMRELLKDLNPTAQKIIRLRYGIGVTENEEGCTRRAVGEEVGVSQQYVQRVDSLFCEKVKASL